MIRQPASWSGSRRIAGRSRTTASTTGADPELAVGRWVHIERVKSVVTTRTGPMIGDIEVRIWVEDASSARRRARREHLA